MFRRLWYCFGLLSQRLFSFSRSLLESALLPCLTIVTMALNNWWCAFVVKRCVVDFRIWAIFIFMLTCIGLRSWLLAISGWYLLVVLHMFLSFVSRLISLRHALDIDGLRCVVVYVSWIGGCIGRIQVAMSWYSWMIVMICAATYSIRCVVAWSLLRRVQMCNVCCVFLGVESLPSQQRSTTC